MIASLPAFLVATLTAASVPVSTIAPQQGDGEAARTRPRIGLVLSGGGARGAAHVGVVEVLEEAHVPVDFVVGTSMGAIIGGLYAAGSSPQEIRDAVEKADWGFLFDDEPPREYLTWRRREESRDFLVDLEMGWKDGGLHVPRGVIQGLKIEPFFRELTVRVNDAPDFDSLPLPFRAVGMDLATGETVVLSDGDLAEAMRASMSIAGAFAPVERDGRELVDGGYVDNLPVGIALQMGADIIIAVDVGTPPQTDVKSIASFLSVATQVQDVVVQASRQRARAMLRDQDVLVEPDLGSISVAEFGEMPEAMSAGRDAARARIDVLADLGLSDEEWAQYLARQRALDRPPQAIASVRIDNRSSLSDAVIAARIEGLGLRELDPHAIDRDLALLGGLEIFDRVDARTQIDDDDQTELVYSVREKSWGPNYLRFGLGIYDDFKGRGLYSLGIGWTSTPITDSGVEWRTEFTIGTPLQVESELWIPLDPGLRWFVAPSGRFSKRDYDLDDDPDVGGEVLTEQWDFGADVGRVLGDWGEVRTGIRRGQDSNTPHDTSSGATEDDFDIGTVVARFAWDTLDHADFPTTGSIGFLEGQAALDALGSQQSFETVELRGSGFTSVGDTTFGLGIDVGTSFDDALPVSRSFFLGGFTRLSGTAPASQSGDTLVLVRTSAWHALSGSERGMLGFPLFVGGTLELGNTWTSSENVDIDELTLAGSVFIACDTPLGPAALVLGATDGEGIGLALTLGRLY